MPNIDQLREQVRDAFSALEDADAAIQAAELNADTESTDTDTDETVEVEALADTFAEAERNHKLAVERLERAERVEAARTNLPVAPAAETPSEARSASPQASVTSEPELYRPSHKGGTFRFFADLYSASKGDGRAAERLNRHQAQMTETRALNSTDGTGGDFVPPAWLMDEWVKVARAGRPFANSVNRRPLPPGTDSINLPRVVTGAAVGAQTDGNTVTNTDATTGSIAIPVRTAAGQQDVSRQLLERSGAAGAGIDEVIADDLLRAYATQIDLQCLNGDGTSGTATGVLNTSSIVSVTYTSASPTASALYSKLADAIQQIHAGRFAPPSAIVMHPRRWAWFLAASDTANRPLVAPVAPYNSPGSMDGVISENTVGTLQGLPVIVDASVPTTLSTNQDAIIVTRLEDLYLYEDQTPRVKVFEETLSGTMQIRIQLYGYFGFTAARYPGASAKITGTGLAAPTF